MKKIAKAGKNDEINQDIEIVDLAQNSGTAIEIDEELLTIYIFVDNLDKIQLLGFRRYFEILKKIYLAGQRSSPINIEFCTNGGQATVGLAMYDIIESSGLPVRTVALGEVVSAGVVVFLAGTERLIHKNSILMTHRSHNGYGEGSRDEVENSSNQLKTIDELMRNIILEKSKLTPRQLTKLWLSERFITAPEAIKWGLAHKIVG